MITRPGSHSIRSEKKFWFFAVSVCSFAAVLWFFFALAIKFFNVAKLLFFSQTSARLNPRFLNIVGTVLILLGKGGILIVLDVLLSPTLCLSFRSHRSFCRLDDAEVWGLVSLGVIFSCIMVALVAMTLAFNSSDCLVKTNYLSSASSNCELFDFFVKVCFVVVANFYHEVGESAAAVVDESYQIFAVLGCSRLVVFTRYSNFLCFEIDEARMIFASLTMYITLINAIVSLVDQNVMRVRIPFLYESLLLLGTVFSLQLPSLLYKDLLGQKLEGISANRLVKKMRMIQSILLDRQAFEEPAFTRKYRTLLIEILTFLESFKTIQRHSGVNYLQTLANGDVLYDPKTNSEIIVVSVQQYKEEHTDLFLSHPTYYKHILSIIMETAAMGKFAKALELQIYHTYFIFFELRLSSKAVNQLIKLKRQAKTFSLKRSLSKLESTIADSLMRFAAEDARDSDTILDIKKLIDLESRFYNLERSIVDSVHLYSKMLQEIDSDFVSMESLKKTFKEFTSSIDASKTTFTAGGGSNNPRMIFIYIHFTALIMQNVEEAKKYYKVLERRIDQTFHLKKQDKVFFDEELMYDEESTLIQVGALKENLGKIISANQGIEMLFGYRSQDLVGKNINFIIPFDLGTRSLLPAVIHQKFLENYIQTGRNYILYKERHLYGIHRTGNLIQVGVSVRPMLNIKENVFLFIAYVQKRQTFNIRTILTNEVGHIISMDPE